MKILFYGLTVLASCVAQTTVTVASSTEQLRQRNYESALPTSIQQFKEACAKAQRAVKNFTISQERSTLNQSETCAKTLHHDTYLCKEAYVQLLHAINALSFMQAVDAGIKEEACIKKEEANSWLHKHGFAQWSAALAIPLNQSWKPAELRYVETISQESVNEDPEIISKVQAFETAWLRARQAKTTDRAAENISLESVIKEVKTVQESPAFPLIDNDLARALRKARGFAEDRLRFNCKHAQNPQN